MHYPLRSAFLPASGSFDWPSGVNSSVDVIADYWSSTPAIAAVGVAIGSGSGWGGVPSHPKAFGFNLRYVKQETNLIENG